MIADIDVWRCANIMMKRYGEDAALEAAQRADALLDKGDCRMWQRIVKAIDELERAERCSDEGLH